MLRIVLLVVFACLLASPRTSQAQTDKTPYNLRIVLHVARHRLLTDVFRQQLRRELGSGLRAALGKLATVDVVEGDDRLPDVLKRGLQRSLDEWADRRPIKTHFVLVDYVRGYYEIQARQYDGTLGVPAPLVRRDRTRDRDYVARVAALLVARDFGLVATIGSEPDARRNVSFTLRGAGVGEKLDRWVKPGAVFAVVRQPSTYLQVTKLDADGTGTARLISRYRLARVSGLPAIQLGTVQGNPLRLRVVQEVPGGGSEPLQLPVNLQVRRHGFDGEEDGVLLLLANGTRDLETVKFGEKGKFDHLAFVNVLSAGALRARIPVPLLGEGLTVLRVPPPGAEEDNFFARRLADLRRETADAFLLQNNLVEEINKLTRGPDRTKAIARVRSALERLAEDHDRLASARKTLAADKADLAARDRAVLTQVDGVLKQLTEGQGELRTHLAHLEKIQREENDPARRDWLIRAEEAKLLEKQHDLDKAIKIYESAPKGVRTPALEKHLKKLKDLWQTKSPEHVIARRFIYTTWPKLDTSGLKAKLGDAKKALEVCNAADDLVGLAKFQSELLKHFARLDKELAALKPDINSEDANRAREILSLIPELEKLRAAVSAHLDRLAGRGA